MFGVNFVLLFNRILINKVTLILPLSMFFHVGKVYGLNKYILDSRKNISYILILILKLSMTNYF
jgi:hypothetical protein